MMIRSLVLLVTATLATPCVSIVSAQVPASATLPMPPVDLGQKVWVMTSEGWEVKGVISQLSSSVIEVSGEAGTKRINLTDVRRIQKKDSNWSGFWSGAAVGSGMVLLLASDCHYHCSDAAPYAIIAGLEFGGIGALIDAVIEGRQTVWTNRESGTIALAPIASAKRIGLGGSISWK